MKKLFLALLYFPLSVLAQSPADEHFDPAAMSTARKSMQQSSGNTTNYLIIAERLENHFDAGEYKVAWEGQGWIGKDLKRLWIKTEGQSSYENNNDEKEIELQLLYSLALDPFWDLQTGLRHNFSSGKDLNYAVFGVQGLAPYWFEVDLAAFISDTGNISSRIEVEYDVLLTQRLILQPRMELNYSFGRESEIDLGKGVSQASLGLRLRYEFKRSFAPYIGLNWKNSYGENAELLEKFGSKPHEFSILLGLRFWY